MRVPAPRSTAPRSGARHRAGVLLATGGLALLLAACGGDDEEGDDAGDDTASTATEDDGGEGEAEPTDSGDDTATEDDGEGEAAAPADGPAVTVGSFNFGESQILGNIYGIALEEAGYEVEYQLDLGTREVILPELENGNIDLLPEYVGSALSVGFAGEPTADLDATLEALQGELDAIGVTALEPAPGQDANAFVVAGDSDLQSLADVADAGDLTFAGPPECEDRSTCFAGLQELYGAENVAFETIAEGSVRVASLREGQVDMILLFSTQPVIEVEGFRQLEDPEGIVPVENIVPVVSSEVFDAYGEDMASLLDEVSATITTEALIDLNGRFELDAEDADSIARDFLTEQGLIGA